jgi:hypothetical protein
VIAIDDYIDIRLKFRLDRCPAGTVKAAIDGEFFERWTTMPNRPGFPVCPEILDFPVRPLATGRNKKKRKTLNIQNLSAAAPAVPGPPGPA